MANINIGGRLHSTATGNTVAGANEILDDSKGKKQSVINQETDAALAGKQATIDDLSTIRSGAAAGATAYQKPASGIPASDLASGVIPTVPTISTDVSADAASDTKTSSPKSVKTYVDAGIAAVESDLSDLKDEVDTIGNGAYEEAWDGDSTPVVADIPAGVVVTYSSASYTGTLAASASTVDKIYLVSDGNGNYDRYTTVEANGAYSWKKVGSTAIPLSNYATKTQVSQLQQEVTADISQLEAKVDENWKFPDTEITGFVDGAYSTNGSYSTNILNKAGAKGKNLEVQPGQKYKIYGTSDSSTWYRCCAVFKADGTKIITAPAGNYTTTPYEVTIPSDGAKMTINLINYNSATDKALLVGDVVDAKLLQGEIDDTNAEVNAVDTINQFQEENRQASDIYSPILIDWMQMCHYPNDMTSLAYMSVISSTEDSITLTQAEAESFFPGYKTPAVVGFLDGSYKVVYFNGYSGSGDVITRADIDDTDLTNAKTIQSLHDTIRDGHGIHLTPSGYLALGQFTADELVKRESQKNENLISGANFFYCTEVALGLTKKNIVDSYGRIVCVAESSYGDNSVTSGMPGGSSLQVFGINGSVITAYATENGGWLNKCYRMACIGNSQWNKLTFKARGRGFVEFQATLTGYTSTPKFSGTADAEIIVDGVTVQTITLKYSQTRYRINGITAKEKIEIKIKNTSANPTYVLVYSFNFWRMTERVDVPSLSGKKIAVLGDSWTQFPNPETALTDHESFNESVVMPNGEVHTGYYGYFPKELARVTGATVDNWGKSNMRADNWGIPMIDELLAYTNYDYVLVEYFINDGNAGIPLKDWASNIKKICQRIIATGARPIVILPCRMNGTNAYGDYHEYLMRGLMNLP